MTWAQFVKAWSLEHGTTQVAALRILRRTFEALAAAPGGWRSRFTVPGFGTFRLGGSVARVVRNPSTGELMELPATTRLKFKAARKGR